VELYFHIHPVLTVVLISVYWQLWCTCSGLCTVPLLVSKARRGHQNHDICVSLANCHIRMPWRIQVSLRFLCHFQAYYYYELKQQVHNITFIYLFLMHFYHHKGNRRQTWEAERNNWNTRSV